MLEQVKSLDAIGMKGMYFREKYEIGGKTEVECCGLNICVPLKLYVEMQSLME